MELIEIKIILKRLYKEYVRRYLKQIFLSLFLSVIVASSTSATAWLLDPAIKKIFIERDRTLAWLIPLGIMIAFFAKGSSLYFARMNLIRVSNYIGAELQQKISSFVLTTDIKTLENKHSGKFLSNITYDTSAVTNLVSTGVLNIMKDSLSLVLLVSLMFYQNWRLALFAIIMMPLALIFAKTLGKRIGKAQIEGSDKAQAFYVFFSEILKASKLIRIYQKEDVEKEKASKVIRESMQKNIKIASIMIRAAPIMETLTGIMIAGFIFYSGKLIDDGNLEINNFFSFLAAMMLAYQPIRSLATINMTIYQGTAAAKRIFLIIDEPIQTKNDLNLPDLKIKNCNIKFKDVGFHYSNTNERAIENINLELKGGNMTALVGPSGSGKSTILNLIPRFYEPQNGNIFIDDQSIYKMNLESLRKNISLVSQDVILFDDTIKRNIAYANSGASEKEIIEACEFAAANEFIEKMPNKYETLIGENGVRLSGGQKQRLSIARAILKKSPIILLDEATSSLDTESEEVVQNAISNLIKNKTTLVIAHRLSTIHSADQIFVIKDGNVLEFGDHSYLIKNSETYKSLYQKQLK
jgi:subfamily B ATP-binding cassette protein MsbA